MVVALVQAAAAAQLETTVYFTCSGCPDATFVAHLHEDTCANNGGGVSNFSPFFPLRSFSNLRLLQECRSCLTPDSCVQHYNGGDGVTVDSVNENWPIVTCTSGVCSGNAANLWAPAATDLANGLSISKSFVLPVCSVVMCVG